MMTVPVRILTVRNSVSTDAHGSFTDCHGFYECHMTDPYKSSESTSRPQFSMISRREHVKPAAISTATFYSYKSKMPCKKSQPIRKTSKDKRRKVEPPPESPSPPPSQVGSDNQADSEMEEGPLPGVSE